ncbi:MAG TPA: hypothetical protein VFD01_17055 [Candidatus Dormibacteraeota bacterium]|nr:hypothetical protein [Candidatus Dormibacteraeota bacterium]
MGRQPFIPGAGAEQLQQAAARAAAMPMLTDGARYSTLRQDPRARIITWDLRNPQIVGSPALVSETDLVAGSQEAAQLPGRWPFPTTAVWDPSQPLP